MKKTVLKYGLISGGISAVLMLIYSSFIEKVDYDKGYFFGYTFIILSFVPIYFGMMHLKNKANATQPTFLKYLGTGLLIALISSVCYALMWTILNYTIFPDFMDKYAAHIVEQTKRSGKSAEEINKTLTQMETYKKLYKMPLFVFGFTILEPLPVGIILSLVSALTITIRGRNKQ